MNNVGRSLPLCGSGILALAMLTMAFVGLRSESAYAEGRCPPGQYPIGDDRAPGCAPIPAGGGTSDSGPKPTGRWIKTWGAIATAANGDAGASVKQRSQSAASRDALSQCGRMGANDCKVVMSYKNQCVAMVTPATLDRGGAVTSRAETEKIASNLAMDICTSRGSSGCKVFYSACSEPIFEVF